MTQERVVRVFARRVGTAIPQIGAYVADALQYAGGLVSQLFATASIEITSLTAGLSKYPHPNPFRVRDPTLHIAPGALV